MKHKIKHHNVSRETFEKINELFTKNKSKLQRYTELLFWWNKRVNLVSRNASKDIIQNHIYHSLLLSTIPAFSLTSYFIDAGTGGGLPGIPLSICFPKKHFYLNDIVSKKILAIKQLIKDLDLSNTVAISGSFESFNEILDEDFIIISKHAFKINDLISLTHNIKWNELLLLKGCHFAEELSSIPYPLYIDCYHLDKGTNNIFYSDKCILQIRR